MATVNNSAGGMQAMVCTAGSSTAKCYNFIGRLISKDNLFLITADVIEVGRNSSTALVDFHVGENRYVSRLHFTIRHDMNDEFTLICSSKNGVFIDNVFHRGRGEAYKLPKLCCFRIPSTDFIIRFENLIYLANNGIMIDFRDPTPVTITGCPMSIPPQNLHTSNSVGSGGSSTSPGGAPCVSGNQSPSCSVNYAPPKISIPSEQGASGGTGQGLLGAIPRGLCRVSLVSGVSGGSGGRGSNIHGGGGGSVGSGYPRLSSPTPIIHVHDSHHPNQSIIHRPNTSNHQNSTDSHSTGTDTNDHNYSKFRSPATLSLESNRPPYSYSQLMVQAIFASPDQQLTVTGIYSFITNNYPYYRTCPTTHWRNSIRHTLSYDDRFINVPRPQDEPGKGDFWRMNPSSEEQLIEQRYRIRPQLRSQWLQFGMVRSAPVAPNYTVQSREGSPINEELLLSAPGTSGQNNSSQSANNHDGSHRSFYLNQTTASASADQHPTEVYEEVEMEYESDSDD